MHCVLIDDQQKKKRGRSLRIAQRHNGITFPKGCKPKQVGQVCFSELLFCPPPKLLNSLLQRPLTSSGHTVAIDELLCSFVWRRHLRQSLSTRWLISSPRRALVFRPQFVLTVGSLTQVAGEKSDPTRGAPVCCCEEGRSLPDRAGHYTTDGARWREYSFHKPCYCLAGQSGRQARITEIRLFKLSLDGLTNIFPRNLVLPLLSGNSFSDINTGMSKPNQT